MAYYMEYSTKIYNIYLKYIAPEDIHIYSIDEVFMDVTQYLTLYHLTARELAMKMIPGRFADDRDHGDSRDRDQSVSLQDRNGYCCKTY